MRNESLSGLLLHYLIVQKKLFRNKLGELVQEWGYEKSNAERRMRELCESYPVKPYDNFGNVVEDSSWISYWKLTDKIKPSTIFN